MEDLALQSSPDIIQARALARRGYLRLVVVMDRRVTLEDGRVVEIK